MNGICIISGSLDKTIKIHDNFPSSHRTVNFAASHVNAIEISRKKNCLAASGFENVCLYDVSTLEEKTRKSFISNVSDIKFGLDDRFLFLAAENKKNNVFLCDCERQFEVVAHYESNIPCVKLAYDPFSDLCYGGDFGGRIHIFDPRAHKTNFTASAYRTIFSMAGNFDAWQLFVGFEDSMCLVFDLRMMAEGKEVASLSAGSGIVLSLKFGDNKLFGTTSSGGIRVWDNLELLCSLSDLEDDKTRWIVDCLPLKEGRFLSTSHKSLKLWDLGMEKFVLATRVHDMGVTCLAGMEI